jgi:hypothetical protein
MKIVARDKKRKNMIQICLNKVNLIWDLDENEEVDFLDDPDHFSQLNFTLTGYRHSNITSNHNESLFA